MNLWNAQGSRSPISCCAAAVRWCALYDYLQGNDKAIEALRRIVQAELMGQFYALKYFADDLRREIRYPISEVQEAAWKQSHAEAGSIFRGRADDFYFTMRLENCPTTYAFLLGRETRGTACWQPSTQQKMILIPEGEDIVGRACIRLTKGAFQRPADFNFSFADLAQKCNRRIKSALLTKCWFCFWSASILPD